MLKRLLVFFFLLAGLRVSSYAQEHRRYALMWHDEFSAQSLDQQAWSKIKRSKSTWAVHMSPADTLYAFDKGDLVLRGMANDFLTNDNADFLTGGIWGRHKKAFGFGRIEIRAKFDVAQGFWPAIWMMPQVNKDLSWPYGGEIDIMEHFGEHAHVDQTVHSDYTYYQRRGNRPPHVAYPSYNEGEYNTYGVERFQDSLVFFVNGKRTFNYPRYRKGNDGQFPFSQHDYYLILDAQLGGAPAPYIDTAKLPVELRIDYVRYYEVDTKTDVVPEPKEFQMLKEKKKKLRKVVYDKKTHFDNPDEYRIVVKCGKVTIAGNRQWAESTLAQLVDDYGRIANLEVHDWAACPKRGVSLDRIGRNLTFDEMNLVLDRMALYKLNGLQWDGEGSLSDAEKEEIRNRAATLGIEIFDVAAGIPDKECLETEGSVQFPASSRIFLHTASGKGGLLYLKGLEEKDWDAVMAFAERYWRGGGAGEGAVEDALPAALSTAGTRLANFMEKVSVHRVRFQDSHIE